jgi:prefoldin subunit 5
LLNNLQSTIDALNATVSSYQTTHAAILAETTGTIQTSDQAALTSAVDAYDALTTQEQNELATEIALLNNLQSTIDSLNTTVSNYQTTHAAILAETTGTIQTSDQAALTSALDAYNALSTQEQNELSTEIALLNDLQTEIDRIDSTVTTFTTTHSYVLGLTTGTVQASDQDEIDAALVDYNSYDSKVQAELTTEKALLDDLNATLNP